MLFPCCLVQRKSGNRGVVAPVAGLFFFFPTLEKNAADFDPANPELESAIRLARIIQGARNVSDYALEFCTLAARVLLSQKLTHQLTT